MGQAPFRLQEMLSQARRLHAGGDAPGAAELFRKVLKQAPGDPQVLYGLAAAELSMGWTGEARGHLAEVLRRSPNDVGAWHDLALVHKRDGRFADAHAALDRALALRPADATLRAAKAGVFQMTGEHARAAEVLDPVLAAEPPHIASALAFARIAARLRRQREAIDGLRRCLETGVAAPVVRADALFQLGDLHDTLDETDAAFGAWSEANAIRTGRFDAAGHARAVDEVVASWTRESVARLPRGRVNTDRPVFIVGMPRSGTSLVEQILASHPSVFGAGELDDLSRAVFEVSGPGGTGVPMLTDSARLTRGAVEKIERSYLDRIWRLSSDAARVTDKMPTNFLRVGVIAAVFPRARIIHCVRDPRDTCISCFTHNFGGSHPWAYDLADLGRFYRDYARMMAHWRAATTLPILDVVYEQLVADTESHSRRMVEFLGLPWDAACLRFHESKRIVRTSSNEQVRRPVYTASVGRWRRYERQIAPLVAALGDAV